MIYYTRNNIGVLNSLLLHYKSKNLEGLRILEKVSSLQSFLKEGDKKIKRDTFQNIATGIFFSKVRDFLE